MNIFESSPIRAAFSRFVDFKVMLFHVNMKSMTLGPGYQIIKFFKKRFSFRKICNIIQKNFGVLAIM